MSSSLSCPPHHPILHLKEKDKKQVKRNKTDLHRKDETGVLKKIGRISNKTNIKLLCPIWKSQEAIKQEPRDKESKEGQGEVRVPWVGSLKKPED